MPITGNYFNPIVKRFDFGVPLEDIFPQNDVHPRLRHLFKEAYKLYVNNMFSIQQVVRQLQGSLEARLKLKHTIIHEVHYDINSEDIDETPGAYFWLIQHFLGLLPIPLLPVYSREIQFDWVGLSEKCRHFLQHYESQRNRKLKLDYEFAQNLNLLPFEHFLLLMVLIRFIRKLSKVHKEKIDRRTLLFLCKYYCASICVRPYTPGLRDSKMYPLFFYMSIRWRSIEKYCRQIGHPTYFLEGNLNHETCKNFSLRDNWMRPTNFSPEIITVYKNIPYFCNNNCYLKDTGSQTEQVSFTDKAIQNSGFNGEKKSVHTNLESNSLDDVYSASKRSGKQLIRGTSTPVNANRKKKMNDNPLGFLSSDDAGSRTEWNEIVAETAATAKKVEEYIYDDYDTFAKEEYNQISEGGKSRGSLMCKVSKIGWTYTPETSARESKRHNATQDEMEETYIKFEDIFDESGEYKNNEDDDERDKKELNLTFKKSHGSKIPLCEGSALKPDKLEAGGKPKKSFSLKMFKLKMDFLRVLTPKKNAYPTPSYDSIESNVKYKKIKNVKSSTL